MLSTLFQYENFTHHDVVMAGRSLFAYALGLLGFVLIKVLVPGFTSRQDMKTPVKFGVYAMGFNMVLNICLVFPFGACRAGIGDINQCFFKCRVIARNFIEAKDLYP
jgi:Uncharacterized membrane protein, putative virulence factor